MIKMTDMHRSKYFNKCTAIAGFTLIELMLAMAISLFLIGGVALLQSSSRATSLEAERLSRLQENIRFTSDLMVRDIRNAGFRDQISLTFDRFKSIGDQFASVESDVLEIRYAGWGSCGRGFAVPENEEAPKEIRNQYFVEDGELKCRGIEIDNDDQRERLEPVPLATGVRSIDFSLLCPSGGTCSPCELWQIGSNFKQERLSLEETCYGVDIALEFEATSDSTEPVTVNLSASFRNILLGRVMWQAVCQINDPTPKICEA